MFNLYIFNVKSQLVFTIAAFIVLFFPQMQYNVLF